MNAEELRKQVAAMASPVRSPERDVAAKSVRAQVRKLVAPWPALVNAGQSPDDVAQIVVVQFLLGKVALPEDDFDPDRMLAGIARNHVLNAIRRRVREVGEDPQRPQPQVESCALASAILREVEDRFKQVATRAARGDLSRRIRYLRLVQDTLHNVAATADIDDPLSPEGRREHMKRLKQRERDRKAMRAALLRWVASDLNGRPDEIDGAIRDRLTPAERTRRAAGSEQATDE